MPETAFFQDAAGGLIKGKDRGEYQGKAEIRESFLADGRDRLGHDPPAPIGLGEPKTQFGLVIFRREFMETDHADEIAGRVTDSPEARLASFTTVLFNAFDEILGVLLTIWIWNP